MLIGLAIGASVSRPPATAAQGAFQVRVHVDRIYAGPIRSISFVCGSLPAQATAPFVVVIPAAPGAVRFRVHVSSFHPGLGVQAP